MNTCVRNEFSEQPAFEARLKIGNTNRSMTPEGRDNPRYQCDLSLDLVGSGSTGWRFLRARSTDISETGIAAVVKYGLFPGDKVQIQLQLSHSKEVLHLPAAIQNRSDSRYGFQFLSLNPCQLASLIDFCRMLEPLQAVPQDRVNSMGQSFQQLASRTRLIQDQLHHIEVLKDILKFTDGAVRQYWTAEIEKLEAGLKHL